MNSLLTFAVLFAWGLSVSPAHGSLLELQEMLTKTTGKNALRHYSFYGCYCGPGGKGQPKDATDRCCQVHDNCYKNTRTYLCNPKQQSYYYSWNSGIPSCEGPEGCSRESCECDRSLALCLKRNTRSYNTLYQFYPKFKCR
ncbi:PA2G5 phospholipase, partial [Bucco capensis]|nr:PA2G5 phospholipase [Bucco capensis]